MRFSNSKERMYWLMAFAVTAAIYSTLFIGKPLADLLRSQDVQAIFFVAGMLLIAISILIYGIEKKPHRTELSAIIGLSAVYLMFIFRLGAPERSHLIEYSVLVILIHKALTIRFANNQSTLKTAILAFAFTFIIGIADELIQLALPNRIFDLRDIAFNGIAALMALTSSILLKKIRQMNSPFR